MSKYNRNQVEKRKKNEKNDICQNQNILKINRMSFCNDPRNNVDDVVINDAGKCRA